MTAFHFTVTYTGLTGTTSNEADAGFQSISGIKITMGSDANPALDKKGKDKVEAIFNPVVLRRAVVDPNSSPLMKWIFKCIDDSTPHALPLVSISVLNGEHTPLMTIQLKNVRLKSWSLGELNAEKGELLIEEIMLDYSSIKLIGF